MPRKRKYTDEELTEAVKSSVSIRAVLGKLGKAQQGGGSYYQIHRDIKRLNLNTSHFLGYAALRGKRNTWTKQRPLSEILVSDSDYGDRTRLKRRLIREGVLQRVCSECGMGTIWNNKPLVLVFDHVNGIHNDNRLENLRLLCPNCNSQQETFAGKNKGRYVVTGSRD